MRAHGITVSDIPKQFDSTLSHSIIANVDDGDELITLPLKLKLKGVISYLDIEHPRYQHINCRRATLTSNSIWNPYSDSFQEQESRVASNVTC